MKHLIWVLLLLGMVGCTDPTINPDPTPTPPPPAPEYTLVIDYFEVTDLTVYEDGYHCWSDNPRVPFSWRADNTQAYEDIPPGVYCACWLRIPPVTFEYTQDGEPTTAIIRHCKIFTVEVGGEEIRIVAR